MYEDLNENLQWHKGGYENVPPHNGMYVAQNSMCEIFFSTYKNNVFLDNGTEEEYTPDEIIAWAYENDKEMLPTPPIEAKIVWHDVNESRPFHGDRVLVTYVIYNHHYVEIADYQQDECAPYGVFREIDKEWGLEIDDVTHWAYLPDPVKPKEAENA